MNFIAILEGGIVMNSLIYIEDYLRGRKCMTSVFEVSEYFLYRMPMTHKKLQKMCYYAYAWYYTLYGEKLFDNGKFEAWIHGPVNRELYSQYRDCGWKNIERTNEPNICKEIKDFLDTIVNTFGDFNGNELEDMTHAELPWKKAREGYKPDENCEKKLDDMIIKEYYSSLMKQNQFD